MKRLVVAFNGRRQESDSQPLAADVKRRSGFFSRPPSSTPAELHVPSAVYSSSSSDGSVVQTPEPEDELGSATPTRATARWASWMRSKSNAKAKLHHVPAIRERASTEPRQRRVPVVHPIPTTLDSDDESDHYDDDLPPPPPSPRPSRPPHSPARTGRVLPPVTLLRSQMNIRAISLSSLIPPLSPPPLLHLPSSPLFPRSSNPARSLPSLQTTRTVLHKTALLRRLESQTLTPSENESIAAFGHRPKHVVPKTRRGGIDDEALSDVKKLRYYSSGLRVWLDRPCFEERCVLWTWDAERKEVVTRRIEGSERAVASLEFSEGVEALAGYTFEPLPSLHARASMPPSRSASLLPPLVTASLSPPCEVISAGSSTPNASTGPPTPTTVVPPISPVTPRKIIRFFPDPDPEDEEDNVPLGYQVLTKREAERLIGDRERQAREDERMKKVYAAEVAAARARREVARTGSMHEVEIDKAKDRRERYTRPAYDPVHAIPRRMASEPDTRSHPQGLSRLSTVDDGKSKHPSISNGWVRSGSSSPVTPPLPASPLYPRSQSMQSVEDLQEAKRRRRMSNFSEGASTPSRPPSAPSASGRSSVYSRTLPRAHSSGSGMSGMNMMMPVPPLPVQVMPVPVFVMPTSHQFFVPQPMPQMPYPLQTPTALPSLPMSRSAEGLRPPRSHHSGRPESSPATPAAPRHSNHDNDINRTSRISVPAPPVSFMQSAPHHVSGFRGPRPSSSR